jgi:NAD+ synthase
MPTSFTPTQDVQDAQELALLLGIQTEYVSIDPICESFFSSLRVDRGSPSAKMPMANIRARARMVVLYYYANLRNYLVAGTSDRSEALIGFFTKYGDGGADFLPIVHLYKTQVRDVARFLGVPEKICKKPSSPQLYPGHKATDEIPVDYDKLDLILVGLFDERLPPHDVGRLAGVPIEVVNETLRRFRSSRHKRAFPPSLARGEYLSASI